MISHLEGGIVSGDVKIFTDGSILLLISIFQEMDV
jgi:hypothetical protein